MRRVVATFAEGVETGVGRVTDRHSLSAQWTPDLRYYVSARDESDVDFVERLARAGTTNICWVKADDLSCGDVVSPVRAKQEAVVHFRETDVHHTLFLTNRCNSYCLMCSQPPTAHDDSWLVEEALDVVRHMATSPRVLGLTGGEPLLLRTGLRRILDTVAQRHPDTALDVLTNGRLFADGSLVNQVLDGLTAKVSWLVPLYGHADFLHDFVVQSPGAFDETLAGLLALQEQRQAIQLRIVLVEPVLRSLSELCQFIGLNLPFAREVALIACEPTGFAMANRELCEVDLHDWSEELKRAARTLERHGIPYLFMNTPLCALPEEQWRRAHKSISDWKNVFAPECSSCAVKERCSGLFAWHERGWKPTKIRPIERVFA